MLTGERKEASGEGRVVSWEVARGMFSIIFDIYYILWEKWVLKEGGEGG